MHGDQPQSSPQELLERSPAATPARFRGTHPGALLWFGLLPVVGFGAELFTGMLSAGLPMFPHFGWLFTAAAAVLVNAAIWLGMLRAAPLLLQAVLHGLVLGMALLYGLVEAPALPLMLMMAIVGLGVLAAAPYWVLLGMCSLVPRLASRWRTGGRSMVRLVVLLLIGTLLPFAVAWPSSTEPPLTGTQLRELAAAMRDPGASVREAELAAALRVGNIGLQENYCRYGSDERDDGRFDRPFSFGGRLGDGRPFWFVRRLTCDLMPIEDAQRAFCRAHGVAWSDEVWRSPSSNPDLEWRLSTFDVRVDQMAAIAKVDWQLEVTNDLERNSEARFELVLPPGAVASGLSLWIDGEERPAAFASASAVQAAYDKVVAKKRDPALLQQIGPGRLHLLLFPITRRLSPMRVRLAFTVPLRLDGDRAELWLPQVESHNCGRVGTSPHQLELHIGADSSQRSCGDAELREAIVVPVTPSLVCGRDADGWVTQQLVPRAALPPAESTGSFVIVYEATESVGEVLADPLQVLGGLPTGSVCHVLFARGTSSVEVRGVVGDEAFAAALRAVPCEGGCDPQRALRRAFELAQEQGVRCVHWLHGGMVMPLVQGRPPVPPESVELASLAVGSGRHCLLTGPDYAGRVRTIVGGWGASQLRAALVDDVRWQGVGMRGALPSGDRLRRFTRAAEVAVDAQPVDDQVARLWASVQADALASGGDGSGALALAARYRLVAAGAGAVVLENAEQYRDGGLDPGAEIGREPERPIGSQPVPEPSTLLLVGSGLLLAVFVSQRRARRQSSLACRAMRA